MSAEVFEEILQMADYYAETFDQVLDRTYRNLKSSAAK